MRAATVLIAIATFVEVSVLMADATPDAVRLGGTALDAKMGEPVAGLTLLAYSTARREEGFAA